MGQSLHAVAGAAPIRARHRLVPEGRELWPALTVSENSSSAPTARGRGSMPVKISRVSSSSFPASANAAASSPAACPRRAADVRHRTRLDERAQAPPPRRAKPRPRSVVVQASVPVILRAPRRRTTVLLVEQNLRPGPRDRRSRRSDRERPKNRLRGTSRELAENPESERRTWDLMKTPREPHRATSMTRRVRSGLSVSSQQLVASPRPRRENAHRLHPCPRFEERRIVLARIAPERPLRLDPPAGTARERRLALAIGPPRAAPPRGSSIQI